MPASSIWVGSARRGEVTEAVTGRNRSRVPASRSTGRIDVGREVLRALPDRDHPVLPGRQDLPIASMLPRDTAHVPAVVGVLGLARFRAHTHQDASASWLQTVNRYRNAVVHDDYLDIFGGGHGEELIESALIHLHDLLVRVVLKLLGYGGAYQPTVSTSRDSRTIDWVKPETPPASLGYYRS